MSSNEQCHFELALVKGQADPEQVEGLRARCRGQAACPSTRGGGCRDRPATPGTPDRGDRAAGRGQGALSQIWAMHPKEGWGGRAGRGGRLEDMHLSESSQSTLTW